MSQNWLRFFIFFLIALSALPAAHKRPAKKSVARAATGTRAATRKTSSRPRHAGPVSTAAAQPARQLAPTNERYREIQEALASKGYLKSTPNGVWDQESQDAMRRFQADRNLDTSGKLTARSLTALGLGSPAASTSPVPTSPVSPKNP